MEEKDDSFNVPPFVGTEFKYMQEAVENHKICGDGPFTKKCNEWLENRFNANRVMLTDERFNGIGYGCATVWNQTGG